MTEKSTQAKAAAQIRKELKEKFPKTKFSVRSESFAGGNAVRIDWTDGVTTNQVEKVVNKYQYGHFDGMVDMYEYSNSRDDIPQVKYVQTSRELSDNFKLKAAQIVKDTYEGIEEQDKPEKAEDLDANFKAFDSWYNWHQIAYRVLVNLDLTDAKEIVVDPNFKCGSIFSGFKVVA